MSNPRLYRARRIDNNEWVKGWYAKIEDEHFIIPATATTCQSRIITEHEFIEGHVEVHPSTVAQSTGKEDKNGDEIFEGMTMIWPNVPGVWPDQLKPTKVEYPFVCGNAHLGEIIPEEKP